MDVAIENSDLLDDLLDMYKAILKENLLLKRVIQKLTTESQRFDSQTEEALAMVQPTAMMPPNMTARS